MRLRDGRAEALPYLVRFGREKVKSRFPAGMTDKKSKDKSRSFAALRMTNIWLLK
jgi:hypothetical protein